MKKAVVLIVDENRKQRESLADIVKSRGHDVVVARSGEEGLSIARKIDLDLALIDLTTKDIPGLELLTRLQAVLPIIPTILYSENPTLESALEAINLGASGYLVKPFEVDKLFFQIDSVLDKCRAEADLRMSEARFRAVLESTPDSMIVNDYKEQLVYQSTHDELTGLPNRTLLADRIGHALHHADRNGTKMAVLFADLDHFKFINDSLGHDAGDQLLQIVASRLTACVRANDTVARQGGDDFVIVLSDLAETEDAATVARKILKAIRQPMTINNQELGVSCSIGISVYPKDGKDVQTLLKNGDAAMFFAKERGRDTFQFFTDDLNRKVIARITMEGSLRRALENGELSVHYQPQVNLRTGRMVGMEALLRWNSPDLGTVSPASFIPLAEETGLIIPIGEWVLKTACRQNKTWQKSGYQPLSVAVNLSPRQFWNPGLIEFLIRILNETGLDPGCLELEITEGMVMRNVKTAGSMLMKLKELGVHLSIDDFGTGYSSFSQLKQFPFDKLKMDISFVREVTFDPGCAAIAKTIIALAHNLDLSVIAEGIETQSQLSYLRAQGCDEMQGFLFSQALASDDFEALLREERVLPLPQKDCCHQERTLLIVDDEPDIIQVLRRVLHNEGYRILSTTLTEQGFDLLAMNRPGVVLCDQRMPGMKGIEFLQKVKSLYPDTIRIAMSGYADLDMVTSAVNQGAIYKFLTKPIDNDLLRQCIAKAFETHESATLERAGR